MNNFENHIDIYKEKSILYEFNKQEIFEEGRQSEETNIRYKSIVENLENDFLQQRYDKLAGRINISKITDEQKNTFEALVDGITSEVGRALVALTFLQLAIKTISPDQNIRLHKGSKNTSGSVFSWKQGISMRSLDRKYNTPFLRKNNLLSINKDGLFMTRSLAENYPYTSLYKAKIKGPFNPWIKIVNELELGFLEPNAGLDLLLSLLINKSDRFIKKTEKLNSILTNYKDINFELIKDKIKIFFNETSYSPRAFEVSIHSFYQAYIKVFNISDYNLSPLSQMRSANKKKGNIGDIELTDMNVILEAWDAKYLKPYLRDELEEINEKLEFHPETKIAGFITDGLPIINEEIKNRIEEIKIDKNVEIVIFSFDQWLSKITLDLDEDSKNLLGYEWLLAIFETFSQKRRIIAPIDEPCDQWVDDLIKIFSK